MDSVAYHTVGKKLFGLQDWKRDSGIHISTYDKKLLDKVTYTDPNSVVVFPQSAKPRGKMPIESIPIPTKKKVRPSSAAANLKSNDCYKTGLFDDARPSTAAIVVPGVMGQPQQRPKTHAGGPRFWSRGKESLDKHSASTDSAHAERRNTVGLTDGIGDKHKLGKPKLNQQSVGKMLKGKVSIEIIY